jgi:hypothetical protein
VDEIDDAIGGVCCLDESPEIGRKHDRGLFTVLDSTLKLVRPNVRRGWNVRPLDRVGIDRLNNVNPLLANPPHNGDWSKQAGCVVDQIQKGRYGCNSKKDGQCDGEMRDVHLDPGSGSRGKQQGKKKECYGESDGVVLQERRRDDPRS